jgi:hypothetical protein
VSTIHRCHEVSVLTSDAVCIRTAGEARRRACHTTATVEVVGLVTIVAIRRSGGYTYETVRVSARNTFTRT